MNKEPAGSNDLFTKDREIAILNRRSRILWKEVSLLSRRIVIRSVLFMLFSSYLHYKMYSDKADSRLRASWHELTMISDELLLDNTQLFGTGDDYLTVNEKHAYSIFMLKQISFLLSMYENKWITNGDIDNFLHMYKSTSDFVNDKRRQKENENRKHRQF